MEKMENRIWALLFAILCVAFTACTNDEPVDEPRSASLEVSIKDIDLDYNEHYGNLPVEYIPYLRIEKLPADEKILSINPYLSYINTEPDSLDIRLGFSYQAINMVNNDWNFEEKGAFIWSISIFESVLPARTYYLRAKVTTNKGVYYTNTKSFKSDKETKFAPNPEARTIPLIFHLFPKSDGSYMDKSFIYDQVEYANMAYSNYWQLNDDNAFATDTKIQFSLAETDDSGVVLPTAGIVYEKPYVQVYDDFSFSPADFKPIDYMWNPKKAINVFVLENPDKDERNAFSGFAHFPFCDADADVVWSHKYQSGCESKFYICLNQYSLLTGDLAVFAHEAGHYLGLRHVFDSTFPQNDFCDDTYFYDRDAYMTMREELWRYRLIYGTDDQYFISANIMDYFYTYGCSVTSDQLGLMNKVLKCSYSLPAPYGKDLPQSWEETVKQIRSTTRGSMTPRVKPAI